jgi:hypothetical protein
VPSSRLNFVCNPVHVFVYRSAILSRRHEASSTD